MNSFKKFDGFLESVDSFATPVNLYLKGRDSIRTRWGGIITILMYAIIAYFVGTKMVFMLDKKESSTFTT